MATNDTSAGSRRRLAILAQFDPQGGVPAYVREHLKGLRPIAERIVLVSNSPIAPEARKSAEDLCEAVIERDNIGWDFAAWRDVIAAEDMTGWDSVILTNSSVIGPLYPLRPIVERMEDGTSDFWGMVMSLERGQHLQSYFLAFSPQVIRSAAWRRFWSGVEDIEDKLEVINRYEIGLTMALRQAGFRAAAMMRNQRFPFSVRMVRIERLKRRIRVPFSINFVNRTIRQHDELIAQGFPYLKTSLVWGRDMDRLRNFDSIRELTSGNFDWSVIDRTMAG